MLTQVTDKVRSLVFAAMSSETGNQIKPVRVLKETLATANDLFGRPFCPEAELEERRAVTMNAPSAASTTKTQARREAAPVAIYFDGKDHRTLKKMEELLKGREIKYSVLDVSNDEATYSWATTRAASTEFPFCFVADQSIGGLQQLTDMDVNGELVRRVFGTN